MIVPAHNAIATLEATLAALAAQRGAGAFEVVVVDDGSTDGTGDVAQRHGVHVLRHDAPRGPAAARNSGRAAARAPVLAFTDADCEPRPDWLARGLAALADADLVQGAVVPVPDHAVGPFDRTLWVSEGSPRLYETANLLVRAKTFDGLGGFRPFVAAPGAVPGLRPADPTEHFGEDVVFGFEARRSGARVHFAPGAVVHHAVFRRGPRAYIRERWRLRYFPALLREVPEMRENLLAGVFLSQRSVRFDLAVAGTALAMVGRRRTPLVAALPYLAMLRPAAPWRRSAWRENLARASADAVSLAALVRGSVAARRLIL